MESSDASTLAKPMETISDIKTRITSSKSSMMVAYLVVGVGFAFFVAFLLYWILTRAASIKKLTYLVEETKTPVPGYDVMNASIEGIPSNWNRGSFGFWIYVNEFSDVKERVTRHVLHVGGDKDEAIVSQPLIKIVSEPGESTNVVTNKMYITFGPKPTSTAARDFDETTDIEDIASTYGVEVEYIPVKRWVHILVTLNRVSQQIKVYVDGQLVKYKDGNEADLDFENMALVSGTNMVLGGKATSEVGIGFPGLISNVKFYNWDMDARDAYDEYRKGPIDNIMAKLGLPAYGVRPPVYKIGSE